MFDAIDASGTGLDIRPLAIESHGRNWAIARFAWPLRVAQECAFEAAGTSGYLIGVSHARLWFVVDGLVVEPVRRGFTAYGTEMNILPWETPADALRRQAPVRKETRFAIVA